MKKTNILIVGLGFFSHRTAADKNFYHDLLGALDFSLVTPFMFSLNDLRGSDVLQFSKRGIEGVEKSATQEDSALGTRQILIYNARRPFHLFRKKKHVFKNGRHYYHHRHRAAWEVIEKSISITYYLLRLRFLVKKHNIQIVHFIDNFGPSMGLVRVFLPKCTVTGTAANYEPRGKGYDIYLRRSYEALHGLIVFSKAYAQHLVSLGVNHEKLNTIHWGVPADRPSTKPKEEIRDAVGITDARLLVLWTGYIQQIQRADFLQTVELIKRSRPKLRHLAKFVFIFKPEVYSSDFAKFAEQGYIEILSGTQDFPSVLEAADAILSPIGNLKSSVSPPLTWLEAMRAGVPVITTGAIGVGEVIIDGKTGFVVDDYQALDGQLAGILERIPSTDISKAAQNLVFADYNIDNIADAYVKFWRRYFNVG